MARTERLSLLSFDSGADLSSDQFKFMTADAQGRAILNTTAGGSCIGVLYTVASAADRAVAVASGTGQIVKVIAGGTVAIGDKIQSSATGLAILAASGDHVQGEALTAAASGEFVEVLLMSEHILA